MTVKEIYNSKFAKFFKVEAITLYPYIFFAKPKANVVISTVIHEKIHIAQVEYFGWVTFYVSYLLYYVAGLIRYKNRRIAYLQISYEDEAYKHAGDDTYPENYAKRMNSITFPLSRLSGE